MLCDPRGALVRPLAVGRCDLDHPMAALGFFPGPFAVGHETVVPLQLPEMYTRGITFHVSRADSRRLLPVVLELFRGPLRSAGGANDDRSLGPSRRAWLQPATKLVLERH